MLNYTFLETFWSLPVPPTLIKAVNKILPLLHSDFFFSLIEFDLHRWLSNQTTHLPFGSELAVEMNGGVVHTYLFQLNLSPFIYHPGVAVLVY